MGVASEAGISLVSIGIGLANLAGGIAALASGPGGLSVGGPPDFGLELGVAEFLGEFFSPALRLAAEAGCDFCPDSRLDLLRVLLGVFQPAEAGAEDAGAARNRVRKASERRPLDADKQPRNPSAPEQSQPKCRPPGTGNSRLGEAFLRAGEALAAVGALETGEALIRSGLAAARMGPVGAAVGVPTAILGAAIGAGGLALSADVISGGAVGIIPPLCQ